TEHRLSLSVPRGGRKMSNWSRCSAGLQRIRDIVFCFVLLCCAVPVFAQEHPVCSAEIAFTNVKPIVNPANVLNLNLFSTVSNPGRPPAKRLFCNNLEGNAEVAATQVLSASSMRIRATILPRYGGVATAEARMTLNAR